jgi:hypothetical protein
VRFLLNPLLRGGTLLSALCIKVLRLGADRDGPDKQGADDHQGSEAAEEDENAVGCARFDGHFSS